jgi:hypothetical protein
MFIQKHKLPFLKSMRCGFSVKLFFVFVSGIFIVLACHISGLQEAPQQIVG